MMNQRKINLLEYSTKDVIMAMMVFKFQILRTNLTSR